MATRIADLPAFTLIGRAARVPLVHRGENEAIAAHTASIPLEETVRLAGLNDVEPRGVLAVSDDLDPDRAEGTESKLNTFSDGFKILGTIAALARHERPALVHTLLAGLVLLLGLPLALIAGWEPLALADITVAAVVLGVGLVLGGLRRTHRQLSRMSFLMQPGLRVRPELVVDDVVAESAADDADERSSKASGEGLAEPVRLRSRMEHVV